ncbi:MAG: hypothetical protein M3280_03990 [Actinomycetota bacterium]|nr:hypothetical protein [Actinomycetota bacterium]
MSRELPYSDLERDLVELGRRLDFPETPRLSAGVAARLRRHPAPLVRRLRVVPSAAVAAVVFASVVAAVLITSPAAREAVADFLGVSGIEIQYGGEETPRIASDLDLGRPVSMDEALGEVSFPIRVPPALGAPDEVYVGEPVPDSVSLVYRPRPGLPQTKEIGVGALLTEFRASVDSGLFKKLIGAGATVQPADIGEEGYWIEGAHELLYTDADGNVVADSARLAANALVWEEDGITYRLESNLLLQRALAIGRDLD